MEVTAKELNDIILRSKFCKNGNTGTLFQLDQERLIKVDSLVLPSVQSEHDLKKMLKQYEHLETTYSMNLPFLIDYYQRIKQSIKINTLPEDIITFYEMPIGVVIKYFQNFQNFGDIYTQSETKIINLFYQLFYAVEELIKFKVYNNDLDKDNILVNGSSTKVELIDLDDVLIYYGKYNADYIKRMYYQFTQIITEIAMSSIKTNEDSKVKTNHGMVLYNDWMNYKSNAWSHDTTESYIDSIIKKKVLKK